MSQQPVPFARFDDLFAADPYGLAAAALDLFVTPKFLQDQVQKWLRGLVVEKGETFLGISFSEPPPLEATEHRIVLIWEHALVASRTIEGSDHARANILLLDPRVVRWPYEQRLAHLRAAGGITDLR